MQVELAFTSGDDEVLLFSLANDPATAFVIQYAALKGKNMRPSAVCIPMKEQYASKARHILEEVDCPPEKRHG
jgi:hypothetical protein